MDVSLVCGQAIYTGSGAVPTDMVSQGYTRQGDAQSSASSSTDSEDLRGAKTKGKKKREEKDDERDDSKAWKLVITFRPIP